jgi:tyrosinase-like protein
MRIARMGIPVVLGLFIAATTAVTAAAQPRVRLNIDDPRFDLDGYKIAVQVLMDRDKDPNHKDDPVNWIDNGYNYFANLHDLFVGDQSGCIHGSEVFLPWHRELLYRFELAIRAAKPGRTDNLTIPYWDWTQKPSGVGYPKAFEDPSSVLYRAIRNRIPTFFYDANTIERVIVDTQDWVEFAGDPCSLKPNCSGGKNCSKCPSFKYGALESPYHNNMHDGMGPTMENPATAVEDPVFWSFHAFIDQIYQRWQCAHQKLPVCQDCNFRGMTDRKVKDVIDIEQQLGYLYDNVPSCSPKQTMALAAFGAAASRGSMSTLAAADSDSHERRIVLAPAPPFKKKAAAAAPPPFGVYQFALTIPEEGFKTADIVVSGLPVSTMFSYSGRVYLYPAATAFKPDDADFARRYKVGELGVWARPVEPAGAHAEHADHGGEAPTAVIDVNVIHALRYLSQAQHGADYRLAVVFSPPHPISDFVKSGAITAEAAAAQIRFTSVELVLDETRE